LFLGLTAIIYCSFHYKTLIIIRNDIFSFCYWSIIQVSCNFLAFFLRTYGPLQMKDWHIEKKHLKHMFMLSWDIWLHFSLFFFLHRMDGNTVWRLRRRQRSSFSISFGFCCCILGHTREGLRHGRIRRRW